MPKGCILSQGYWLTCAKSHGYCDGISYKRILAANPFFYMTPQWLTLMTLMQRGTLYVAPYRSLSNYIKWINDYKIQFCLFPTEIHTHKNIKLNVKIKSMLRGNIYNHDRSKHLEMENRFGFPLRTAFGMTEIGSGTYMPLDGKEMIGSGSCGINAPFRNCRVIDDINSKVIIGKIGELEFKGSHMFLGYHNNTEASNKAMNGKWFKTGDLAYQDKNGFLYIVGRIKDMIRRSGENIAAFEIEEIVNKLDWVKECAALPVEDEMRGEEVKLYIVSDLVSNYKPNIIIEHCKNYLANFKIPRYIVYRNRPLPRSAGGSKIRKPVLKNEKLNSSEACWDNYENKWI